MTEQKLRLSLDEFQNLYGGEIKGPWLNGCQIAGQAADIYHTAGGGFNLQTPHGGKYSRLELMKFVRMDCGLADPQLIAANDNQPIDVWAQAAHPSMPPDLLPEPIADFATVMSDTMGTDPAGLAMSALAVCGAAIPDTIEIQPKEHDKSWTEAGRLWVGLVGLPSTKKSPIISAAVRPLRRLDYELYRDFAALRASWDELSKDERKGKTPPRHVRMMLEDTTIEAAGEVLRDSPNGVLLVQDELSGWFGSMDKYAGGGRGAAKDRSFWLESFNGGPHTVNRVSRGASVIPNLSISLLGGIQPEPLRAIAKDAHDDGLLQRLLPISLRAGAMGKDVPQPDVAAVYGALVERLSRLKKPTRTGLPQDVPLRFSPAAQLAWADALARIHGLGVSWESVNTKLAAHIHKYPGILARMCLIFHCIESDEDRPDAIISESVTDRASRFLLEFLYRHAVTFYTRILGLSDRQEKVEAVAGWILTHRPVSVTVRAVRRGDRIMRAMNNEEAEAVLHQLDAFGWLAPVPTLRRDSKEWRVDERVYGLFEERAEGEAERRAAVRQIIAEASAA